MSIHVCGTQRWTYIGKLDNLHCQYDYQSRQAIVSKQPGKSTKHQHSSNQHISISFSQQHEVKDSPRSVSLTDSMEAFSNKLCAANRAACASSFRPASRTFRLAARPCSVAIRRTGPQVTWASQSQNYDTILCSRFSRGSKPLCCNLRSSYSVAASGPTWVTQARCSTGFGLARGSHERAVTCQVMFPC